MNEQILKKRFLVNEVTVNTTCSLRRNGFLSSFVKQCVVMMLIQCQLIAYEAWFFLNGHVNTQNNRYWSVGKPRLIHKLPLHDIKVGVWCAIVVTRMICFPFLTQLTRQSTSDKFLHHFLRI